MQDSLSFQKMILFSKTKEWSKAIDSAIEIFEFSQNDSLQHSALPLFEKCLTHLSPAATIEKITEVINKTNNHKIQQYVLLLLGSVYERNHLFSEAKDVYYVLLNDSAYPDTTELYLKIVRSEIYLQEFSEALQTLDFLMVEPDSVYVPEIKFLQFIANYTAGDKQEAEKIIIDLYLYYPEHKNRLEIIEAAAELSFENKQYLLSWYFWEKLYNLSSAYKKMSILKTIEEVKSSLVKDSLAIGQFKFFKPIIERQNEKKEPFK
jgi:tetratricopeptide (TPR) repeat protein